MTSATLFLFILSNAIRWWGALAGLINLADILQHLIAKLNNHESKVDIKNWNHPFLICSISLFLVVAGISIPLTHLVPGFTETSFAFAFCISVAWYAISSAGWYLAINLAENRKMMIATSIVGLVVLIIASFMSGV